jgi:hypothetical protein
MPLDTSPSRALRALKKLLVDRATSWASSRIRADLADAESTLQDDRNLLPQHTKALIAAQAEAVERHPSEQAFFASITSPEDLE